MEQKLIDCHAHLISNGVNTKDIIDNINGDNLEAIVCIGTGPFDVDEVVDMANKNKQVYAAIAYHPEYVNEISESDFFKLEKLSVCKKVVAIGECGLDYHYDAQSKDLQKELLKKHIELAIKVNKPIMLHIREAEEDAISILKPFVGKLKNIIIHCYSSVSEVITKQFVQMGCYISFAGNFTYKKYRREDIKLVPLNRILVETDSPYLSPGPLRGTKNEPKNVHHTAQAMADELEMDVNKLKIQLVENARRVFEI